MRFALFLVCSLSLHGFLYFQSVPVNGSRETLRNPIWLAPASAQAPGPSTAPAVSKAKAGEGEPVSPAAESGGSQTLRFDQIAAWGNEPPEYPEEARIEGWEGQVLLELFAEQGLVRNVAVLESSGYDSLDDAALEAAKEWKVERVFEGKIRVPVQFQLTQP